MNSIIQAVLTAVIVIAAVAWVIAKARRKSTSCGDSPSCHCCPLTEKCDKKKS